MHIRCPHCDNAIEVVEERQWSVTHCSRCGSDFNLVGDETLTQNSDIHTLGRFQLLEQLGVGAFGVVWKAKDPELDRLVAVKIPRNEQLSSSDRAKFFREARAAAQLKHPGIVGVHEIGQDGNTIYIVTDFIQGVTLAEWVHVRHPEPVEVAQLCAKVAEALHAAHEAGVVHRDLKPSNILLDTDCQPHIVDFGLAKREAGEITMTVDGQILGTPAYMSPEQAEGTGHKADRRSDVYSLGVILFELLTGRKPFLGDRRMLVHQVISENPPRPRKLNRSIPRDLETICLKCLEKTPAKRYATAKEFVEDIERFLKGEPIRARPTSVFGRTKSWVRRNPLPASLSTTLLTLMLVLVCVALERYGKWRRIESVHVSDEIAIEPHQLVEQVVQVKGRPEAKAQVQVVWEPPPGAVAFCLDCSESMLYGNRMTSARRTLSELLNDLEEHPNVSVSLWLFGHRRFAKRDEKSYRLTWSPVWADHTGQRDDPNVTFENDIQLIWKRNAYWLDEVPLLKGVTGEPNWSDWLRQIGGAIQPFGFTPLHRVMETAIKEHLAEERRSMRQLIVLSDGKHFVGDLYDGSIFEPPWQYEAEKDRTAEDVGELLKSLNRNAPQPIRVLVIGDVEDTKEREELRKTIDAINQQAGDVSVLVEGGFDGPIASRMMRGALGLYSWSVLSEGEAAPRLESDSFRGSHVFGRNDVFSFPSTSPSHRHKIVLEDGRGVELATAFLLVEGDEAFRLEVKQDDDGIPRLVHQRFHRGGLSEEKRVSDTVESPDTSSQDPDFNPPKIFVTAHPPERSLGGTVQRFPVSIQNADPERFSPRPVEIWAEVTPLHYRDGTTELVGQPFVFYDPVWETARPVPVLLLDAEPWPTDRANAAEIRVWFKLQESSETQERRISSILVQDDRIWKIDKPPTELEVTLQPAKGIDRGWDVIVRERNLDIATVESTAASTSVRVDVWPRADVVTRQFYPAAGRVEHVFRLLNVDETSVGAYRLRVTSADAIRKDAAEFQIVLALPVPH